MSSVTSIHSGPQGRPGAQANLQRLFKPYAAVSQNHVTIQTTVSTVQFQFPVGLQVDEPFERFLVCVLHGLSEFDSDSFDMIRRDLGRRCPVDFHPGKPSCVIDCFVREPFVSQPIITTPLIGVDDCPHRNFPLDDVELPSFSS